MPFRILNIHHSIDMKVEAPRDTHLCGAWRCRAEKLQQQPQHWQSLHPNVATLHLQHRVYHVSRVTALTCCVAHAMLHPGLLGLYCRLQRVSPGRVSAPGAAAAAPRQRHAQGRV